jgi:hypothetical protein
MGASWKVTFLVVDLNKRMYVAFRDSKGCRTTDFIRRIVLQFSVTTTCIYIHTDGHTTIYTPKPSNLYPPSSYFIYASDQRHLQSASWASLHHTLPARYIISSYPPPSLGIPDPSSGVAKCTLRSALPTSSSAAIVSGN